MPVIVYQKAKPKRKEAFWYNGPIASIGKYLLIATGEIRVTDPEGHEVYRDQEAPKWAASKGYTDKDLNDKKMVWDNNNWFEVVYGTVDKGPISVVSIEDCIMGDVAFTYDEGMAMLRAYVKDRTYEKSTSKTTERAVK